MDQFLLFMVLALSIAMAVLYYLQLRSKKAELKARSQLRAARQDCDEEIARAKSEIRAAKLHCSEEIARVRGEKEAAIAYTQQAFDQKVAELDARIEEIRAHYDAQAKEAYDESRQLVAKTVAELEPLRGYASLQDAEAEVKRIVTEALNEAASLRYDAQSLLDQTKEASKQERVQAQKQARQVLDQAEIVLVQATRDAGRIAKEAEKRAQQIAGDAYTSLREKTQLEQVAAAMRNVIDGYGDRYIIPTHSLLDDLASDFGHTAAGQALRSTRDQSRRMVEHGEAAQSGYEEAARRETAVRFIVDAFNGRVDAILSRVRHNNYGTLAQEIRDAYSLVNLNGQAFRDSRIFPAYLDSRLAELRWAVVTLELKAREREEQRQIQEQIREEEKARRDYERAIEETAREEAAIKLAMDRTRAEAAHASEQERAKFEMQLAELQKQLTEAEEKNQRALSMAQQTRAGHVYIISNIGSFGEEVFKVGMTRRLDPKDRVKELGDASVPFAFDIHAMIYSEDAPSLERLLHSKMDELRINKVNYRKEFFRLPLDQIRTLVSAQGLDAQFTLLAEAREYRETVALEKMTPEDREKYHVDHDVERTFEVDDREAESEFDDESESPLQERSA
jgi:DNA repair exonuclease SbcCD ATPase subunit